MKINALKLILAASLLVVGCLTLKYASEVYVILLTVLADNAADIDMLQVTAFGGCLIGCALGLGLAQPSATYSATCLWASVAYFAAVLVSGGQVMALLTIAGGTVTGGLMISSGVLYFVGLIKPFK